MNIEHIISYLDISEINEDEHRIVLSRKLSFSEVEKTFIENVLKDNTYIFSNNQIILIKNS